MVRFSYKAVTANGQSRSGAIEAPSQAQAIRQLQQSGLIVLQIDEAGAESDSGATSKFSLGGRISLRHLMEFTSETSSLLDAGVPLEQVLKTQAELCTHDHFKKVLMEVWQDVTSGAAFADALAKHRKIFEPFYVNMVRGGEASGSLDLILRRLSDLLERRQRLRSKVTNAMIYPMILLTVGTLVIIVLMVAVIPKFGALFNDQTELLPPMTRVMMSASDFLVNRWWVLLLAIAGIIGGFKWFVRNEEGKEKWGDFMLKLPLFGELIAAVESSRFCRMMGALLNGQVPILKAIAITGGTLGNAAFRKLMRSVYENVQAGKPMGPALQQHDKFPELATRMISMGEKSGELEPMLEKVADRYEERVNDTTERLVGILEPLFIVVMGGVVGFIVISMMSGIMAMSTMAE